MSRSPRNNKARNGRGGESFPDLGSPNDQSRKFKYKADQSRSQERDWNCVSCDKAIALSENLMFVEQEVGRIFCSEDCILAFFEPDVERLDRLYEKFKKEKDLKPGAIEKLAHLRWSTLKTPHEVWKERTVAGDDRYVFVAKYEPPMVKETLWSVCVTLCLESEPSFLYIAFVTRDPELVDQFRFGEKQTGLKPIRSDRRERMEEAFEEPKRPKDYDGIASNWTEQEAREAQFVNEPTELDESFDYTSEDAAFYEKLFDQTLEMPDEVWVLENEKDDKDTLFHFIKTFMDKNVHFEGAYHYVVVGRLIESTDELEILENFVTEDRQVADEFRKGKREVNLSDDMAEDRVIH